MSIEGEGLEAEVARLRNIIQSFAADMVRLQSYQPYGSDREYLDREAVLDIALGFEKLTRPNESPGKKARR